MTLAEFLSAETKRPLPKGRIESCSTLWVADWIKLRHGFDLAEEWRSLPVEEHDALIEKRGGLLKMVRRILKAKGFKRTDDPQEGDIAAAKVPVRNGMEVKTDINGVICVGSKKYAQRTCDIGLLIADVPIVVAWKMI